MRFDGMVAVVTGAGSGIGEATARVLAGDGASVAVLDINTEQARLVAESLPGSARPVVANVADSAAVDRAFAEVEAELGPVDILVNNAGIPGRSLTERITPRVEAQMAEAATGHITTPLESTVSITDAEWAEMLHVHLFGTFYCTRAALRSMTPRQRGAIVNIASICGVEGCTGFPHYSAAKGGILSFTRAVAKEVILQGVRVNAVAAGYVDTPMAETMTPAMRAALAVQTPLGRMARAGEIAATAAFLASEDASFFVGATLTPSGGLVTV
ncbi:MAG: SDR family NAD(P)-dependent oxidoreductase [Actinomycetota bacterium]|jgi:3-oxoacyl-[acyl-carrier protein] reductase|nr:SDR family NAD(P)-dependent oxidoreductase [Actinomycetota bacterium]